MSWLNHPRFVPVREQVVDALKAKEFQFRRTKPVVFLCGGYQSERRERLAQYLRERLDYLVFYAEEVWAAIANQPGVNALKMEGQLATLSDVVVLIVESPGTFAELGAFSLSDPLRQKLLPILDRQHREAESFIVTGPVRWVNRDSSFAPCIWVRFDSILEASEEVADRLRSHKPGGTARVPDLAASLKHLLFFVCDLVAIFGPCPQGDVEHHVAALLGDSARAQTPFLLGLATSMRLIKRVRDTDFFYRPLKDDRLPAFQYTPKYVDIPTLRARALSSMMLIPEALAALQQLEDG